MQSIITYYDGKPVVSHRVVAENVGYEQRSVRILIDQHKSDFEEFGVLSFEMTKPQECSLGGRPEKTYYLNEHQATLLMTYMRNSEQVRKFKKTLVKTFYELKKMAEDKFIKELANRVDALETQRVSFKRVIGSPLTDKEKETIKELRNKNWGVAMISQHIGCSECSVRRVLKANNTKKREATLFGGIKKYLGG